MNDYNLIGAKEYFAQCTLKIIFMNHIILKMT